MRFLSIFILFIFFSSCKNPSDSKAGDAASQEVSGDEAKEAKKASYDVNDLVKYVGKMPSEANIFQVANLGERTKNIMGKQFINLNSGWFDKLPIQKYEDYIFFGGCEFENCDGVKYFIIVDLTEDNVNVLHFGGKRPYSFEEGAIIGMPDHISDAFEKFRK